MNKLMIIGNLTKEPEGRTTKSGKPVCSFTVAVSRRNDKDNSDFFRVSAWGDLGMNCAKYLNKGKKVCVVGSVSASAYTAQDGTARASLDVFAESVEFLSPKDETVSQAPQQPAGGFVKVEDEQLPWE